MWYSLVELHARRSNLSLETLTQVLEIIRTPNNKRIVRDNESVTKDAEPTEYRKRLSSTQVNILHGFFVYPSRKSVWN